jgi:hypothetical protein
MRLRPREEKHMKKILIAAALGLVSLSCYSAGLYGPGRKNI